MLPSEAFAAARRLDALLGSISPQASQAMRAWEASLVSFAENKKAEIHYHLRLGELGQCPCAVVLEFFAAETLRLCRCKAFTIIRYQPFLLRTVLLVDSEHIR